jgi:uncharacterized protein (TIGR02453 family)
MTTGAGFRGWPADALAFYRELGANNTKAWWQANKERYDAHVKEPFLLLADEVRDEFGPLHVFRPYRDARFSKDKTPYKTNAGAVTEGEGGTSYYVQLNVDGLYCGAGYYRFAPDQLERYREAVAGEHGEAFVAAVAAVRKAGFELGGEALKTAPRGWPKDHPRIELLRHKGIYLGRAFPPAKWLSTRAALDRITGAWRAGAPFCSWLDTHVGPSELPPEDAW